MRKFLVAKGYEGKVINMPVRSTSLSAGYDISTIDEVIIPPHGNYKIPTGLKAAMEEDDVLLILPRSSLASKHSLRLTNTVGVIDADYFENPDNDGHIFIMVYNFSDEQQELKKGERIAQGIFVNYLKTDDDQTTDKKRLGGIGSTGN